MKHIYTFLCFFLFSGVVNADSSLDATLFDDPARLLLTFAEISIALTAFSGIAVVIGRRGGGQWTELDVLRFTAIIINGQISAKFLNRRDNWSTNSGDISVLLCAISQPIYETALLGFFFTYL